MEDRTHSPERSRGCCAVLSAHDAKSEGLWHGLSVLAELSVGIGRAYGASQSRTRMDWRQSSAHRSWLLRRASIACNLSHQKMHVYGVPHLHHLAVFQAIHSRSRILDTPARRRDASKLSCVRATVGDPRRHPRPFSNLLLNSHLQVRKRPADLSNSRDLSRKVGVAIERRSRCEIPFACDHAPALGDFVQVG